MRLRKVCISKVFPNQQLKNVISNLNAPNLKYLSKCLDFKIHEIDRMQVLSQTLKKCLLQTDYGYIQLCLETISNHKRLEHRIDWYNLQVSQQLWAATYQQTLLYQQQTPIFCLTFRQVTKKVKNIRVDKALIQLPKTFYYMNKNGYDISTPLQHIVQSQITGEYYLDYFHIDQLQRTQNQIVKSFLKDLSRLSSTDKYLKSTIYLLQDQVYTWKINQHQLVQLSQIQVMDWFLLSILMNLSFISLCHVRYSYVDSPQIIKKGVIQQLSGYFPLEFRSGQCINQYQIINPTQLKSQYFEILKTYRVVKKNVLSVIKQPNTINPNQSYIIIDQLVRKIDCVQFFIIYMKYFELNVENIIFKKETNQLLLTLSQGKYIVIKFYKDYLVKEEQISIIINKSNLINCQIDLQNSNVSDKFLILLSNIDKSDKIKKLNLSNCKELTEFGLNTLFESNNLRNLTDINLSNTAATQETIDLMKLTLLNLQKLTINNCELVSQELNFKDFLKLQKLTAIGTWIDPIFSSKLKVLKLSIQFPIENLKILSKMPLQQLKLKLVENRKQQIVNFVNNLYSSSSHYTKQFMQGTAIKTLKSLDLSESSVKYKLIKSLFTIKTLIEISLSKCNNLGDEFDHINKQIQSINVQQANLNSRNIKTLINKCVFIKNLNIRGTLSKKQTCQFIEALGKNINELFINQSQYSDNLLKNVNKGGTTSINKLSIKISSINQKTERMLRELSVNLEKLINIQCEQQLELIQKVYSIMGRHQKSHLRLKYEELQTVEKRIQFNQQKSDWLELGNCHDTTVFVHKIIKNSRNKQKIKINLRNNRYLSSPIIDIISVFANSQVKAIDIRNCLFKFEDVQEVIMNWENIEQVNDGQFQINFTNKNFNTKSNKYLKFLMKIHNLKTLVVSAKKVKQIPFMFSLLHYIINHHKLTLQKFQLNIQQADLSIKDEISEFWQALLTTITLKDFSFSFKNCKGFENSHFQKLKSLNYLNLHRLSLYLPGQPPFPLKIQNLKQLNIQLSEQNYVNDSFLSDLIRGLQFAQKIDFDISKTNINSVQKFSSSLKSLKNLKQISLNFQYCPIKSLNCINILQSLKDSKRISRILMNISFTQQGIQNLANQLISISDQINQPIMQIIALRVSKQQIQFQKQMQLRYITLLV